MSNENKISLIPIWKGDIDIKPLEGGITNFNYIVQDSEKKVVVRLGSDIPEHLVFRQNEILVSKAAYEIGTSPKLIHNEQGIMVIDFIEGKTLDPQGVRENLERIIPVIKKIHKSIPMKLSGQPPLFWVFYVIKYYANFLLKNDSNHIAIIPELLKKSETLETISSPRDIVFGHNDLLAANFLDDGSKIWIVDWEYGGFNDPLFDLGGLASNNDFTLQMEERSLEIYFEKKPSTELLLKYKAMKTASLLRETMWSMVSEISSKLDFDYGEYTSDNLIKFNRAFENLK